MDDMKRLRKVHSPVIELATFKWVTAMLERGALLLSDDLIIAATKKFYELTPRESSEKVLCRNLNFSKMILFVN